MGEAAEKCSEIPAEEEGEFKTSSFSHSFRLEWKIPKEAFVEDSSHVKRPIPKVLQHLAEDLSYPIVESSKLFEFKNSNIHIFNLVLQYNFFDRAFQLKLLTDKPKEGPVLEYAFVSNNKRLFHLNLIDKSPPNYMTGKILRGTQISTAFKDHKYITIVCGIGAVSSVNVSEDSERLVWEWSLPKEPTYEKSWPTSNCGSVLEAFDKYSATGLLPTLSVELAKELLVLSTEKKNAELRAMCVEYLLENLSAENVVEVLHASCDSHARDLVAKCKDFINKFCRVVPKKKY